MAWTLQRCLTCSASGVQADCRRIDAQGAQVISETSAASTLRRRCRTPRVGTLPSGARPNPTDQQRSGSHVQMDIQSVFGCDIQVRGRGNAARVEPNLSRQASLLGAPATAAAKGWWCAASEAAPVAQHCKLPDPPAQETEASLVKRFPLCRCNHHLPQGCNQSMIAEEHSSLPHGLQGDSCQQGA